MKTTYNKTPLSIVKSAQFLPNYAGIKYGPHTKQKMRGRNSQGKPLDFTPEEKAAIKTGLKRLIAELKKVKL